MDEQRSTVALAVDAAVPHEAAWRWIAARWPAGDVAVHVVDVVQPGTDLEVASGLDANADGTAARLAEAMPGATVTVEHPHGWVLDELLRASADADLVVVGAYRHHRGTTTGRVPTRLAERATVPVVVVPDEPHPIQGDVVLAVDEPIDERAFAAATGEARRLGRRLTLLRAWEMPVVTRTGLTDFAEDPLRWRRSNAELLERVAEHVRTTAPDLRVHPLLVEGHPGRAIADHTRRASLVVLGRGHVRVLSGSVLHDVLRGTHAPVYVVPALPDGAAHPMAETARRAR